MREVRLALAGYGTVGRALHAMVHDRRDHIRDEHGIDLRITHIARTDRYAHDPAGLTPGRLDWTPGNVFEMLGEGPADIFLEATPTDLQTAQPALGHVRGALRDGLPVVLANKGPLVVAYEEVMQRAAEAGVPVRFEATVAGCIPTLNTVRHGFAGDTVQRIEGILNGTSNFILSRMATEGSDLETALKEAQELGYAEADPSADLDGLDAAAKVVILANAVLGQRIGLGDVKVEGIRGVTRHAVELAASRGHRIRLIAEADRSGTARVTPRLVPVGHSLDVQGVRNAVRFTTELAGSVTHMGNGAGGRETAAAMLSDVLGIAFERWPANV